MFVRSALYGLALHCAALLGSGPAAAAGCAGPAIDALKAAPNGYAVFSRVPDAAFFRTWLDCEDGQYGLPTAVHESVHLVTADSDAYPLVGGGAVRRPAEGEIPLAPATIAHRFRPSLLVTTYLRPGGATSATDVRYLLDELNAYTHDLDTALALDGLRRPDVDHAHRDGLAALMSFVAVYVEAAEGEPATWRGLNRPAARTAVSALWRQAERTMAASCGIPGLGIEDKGFLRTLCGPGPQAALGRLLGRAPSCPRACLATEPRTASRE